MKKTKSKPVVFGSIKNTGEMDFIRKNELKNAHKLFDEIKSFIIKLNKNKKLTKEQKKACYESTIISLTVGLNLRHNTTYSKQLFETAMMMKDAINATIRDVPMPYVPDKNENNVEVDYIG